MYAECNRKEETTTYPLQHVGCCGYGFRKRGILAHKSMHNARQQSYAEDYQRKIGLE